MPPEPDPPEPDLTHLSARRRTPPVVWLVLIVAAAVATWFAAAWVVNFVIRANQTGG